MKKKNILITISAVAALIISGCILTMTDVVTQTIVPLQDGSTVTISNADYSESEIEVNLNTDSDFEDIKEHLASIDNIGFYMEITNNRTADATFQLIIESDTSINYSDPETLVDSLPDLIFTGLTVPASSTRIVKWNESMEYITGFDEVTDILKTGTFSIYPLAMPRGNFSVTIDSLVVIVTLTGKK